MFVTDIGRSAEVVAVHGEVFGEIRPAATMVEVSALMDPSLLDRDRGRGAARLSVGRTRRLRPGARPARPPGRWPRCATAATSPRNRFRRQATIARQTRTATHSIPTWNDGTSSSSTTTMTLTAASAARTAGPTSWR